MSYHNEIFIHTDKGSYIGGDIIYGTVFVAVNKPMKSKGIILEIIGYEKAKWEYQQSESYQDSDGQMKSRTVIKEHSDDHTFFKDHFKLVDYPGEFPYGRFSYPFQYRLPADLPGVFRKKRKHGLKMIAKIQYKIKCIVEIPGIFTHDLKTKQHLVIQSRLDKMIESKHIIKDQTVRTLCCIPRGPVRCEAWVDKNAYMSGEVAQIHVNVTNDSAVDVTHFNTKLIREMILHAHGHTQTFREIVALQKYPGTPQHSSKEAACPLPLFGKKGHFIQPFTHSKLVKCSYKIMIEMAIPWAPDLEIYIPVSIYAPQNQMWAQWQPPTWIAEAKQQQVNAQLAVPVEVIAQQMVNGIFHSPSAPPIVDVRYNQNALSNNANIIVDVNVKETSPLLG